jgi:hypothetical protein
MRRDLISLAVAVVGVPLVIFLIFRQFPDGPPTVLAFPKPTHRVAVAVKAALDEEMSSVTLGQVDFGFWQPTAGPTPVKPPVVGQFPIAENDPYFWVIIPADPAQGIKQPFTTLVQLTNGISFDATTKQGRTVQVEVRDDPIGDGGVVDCSGDAALAARLSPRIAYHLAHPKHPHDSPEDRADLMAFFQFKSSPALGGPAFLPVGIPVGVMPTALPPSDPFFSGVKADDNRDFPQSTGLDRFVGDH